MNCLVLQVDLLSSQKNLEKLAKRNIVKLHVPSVDNDISEVSNETVQQDYLINTLQASNHYSSIIKYSDYIEVNQTILDLFNRDWKNARHYSLACLQSLVGAILVENNQILLVNCIEIYGRKPSIDIHHERFSGNNYSNTTIPTPDNLYSSQLNITTRYQDSLRKLMICTKTFNALVVSSIRLDIKTESELGPSTLNFLTTTKK
ncbi:hypothetical protein HPULCUR_001947 [Helicostylum pulchrum]|uniref:Uncharacterized protein n=1 Tax=Helicostylum pulchrum TaxID=562976 RepID=A0ABP9XP84_9FUNG